MADAKIEITADASQAGTELGSLREKIDAMLERLGATGDVATKAGDILEKVFQETNLSAGEANQALDQLEQSHKKGAESADGQSISLKGLTQSFIGVISVAAILKANYKDIQEALSPLIESTKEYAKEQGASQTAVDLFSNSIEMMIKPTTIAKNLIANFKIAWEEFAKGAGLSEEATGKLSDRIERINGLLAQHQQKIKENREELQDRVDVLALAIRLEKQSGEVQEESRQAVEKLVQEYEKLGEIPPKLDVLRQSLGILTEAEKDAANEAQKLATAAERAAEKLAKQSEKSKVTTEATVELGTAKEELAKILGDVGLKLDDENEALEENARLARDAADAAREQLEANRSRISELEGKQSEGGSLDPAELAELFSLQEKTTQKQFEYGEAALESSEATDALNDAQSTQIDQGAEIVETLQQQVELTQEQRDALGDIGNVDLGGSYREWAQEAENFYDGQGNLINQAEQFGDTWLTLGDTGEKVLTNFTAELGRTESGVEDVSQGLTDLGGSASGAAGAVSRIADETRRIGDEAAKGAEKASGVVQDQIENHKLVNKELRISIQLAHELEQALAAAAAQV